jgi:hypothetical protein
MLKRANCRSSKGKLKETMKRKIGAGSGSLARGRRRLAPSELVFLPPCAPRLLSLAAALAARAALRYESCTVVRFRPRTRRRSLRFSTRSQHQRDEKSREPSALLELPALLNP